MPYLVFEWTEGRTLEDELHVEERLSLRRAVWIARQTADAMRDLECDGLAHGDIKPQNIFITHPGRSETARPGIRAADRPFGRPTGAGRVSPARPITWLPNRSRPASRSP